MSFPPYSPGELSQPRRYIILRHADQDFLKFLNSLEEVVNGVDNDEQSVLLRNVIDCINHEKNDSSLRFLASDTSRAIKTAQILQLGSKDNSELIIDPDLEYFLPEHLRDRIDNTGERDLSIIVSHADVIGDYLSSMTSRYHPYPDNSKAFLVIPTPSQINIRKVN